MSESQIPFFYIAPDPLDASSTTSTVYFSDWVLDVVNFNYQTQFNFNALFLFFIVFFGVIIIFKK